MRIIRLLCLVVAGLLITTTGAIAGEPENEPSRPDDQTSTEEQAADKGFWSRFKDPEDGKFDVTAGEGGESAEGFLPLLIPFNEPAVGVGLIGALAYFHARKPLPEGVELDKTAPPTTSFAGGAYAENETWGGAVGHARVFKGGRQRYLGILGYADANLDFYGIGRDEDRNQEPVSFNIKGFGTSQRFTHRIGTSRFFVGGAYTYAAADVELDTDEDLGLDDGATKNAGLSLFLRYDTRDTTFTPNRGSDAKVAVGLYSEALGGDFNYTRLDLAGYKYLPLAQERLILGLRLAYSQAGEESPFWALPFIRLRGVPAFRYLGHYLVTTEVEPRWKIDGRWSVLAFVGAGRAAEERDMLSDAERAYGYGGGFRYLLARKLGLGAGVDIARGPEETTFYITVGSAWMF